MTDIVKRVRKSIPATTARKLWVSSGGWCQYRGCPQFLLEDSLTKRGINKAYISHVIAASPDGPRGDDMLSEKLEIEYSNLMLLCDECHNRIDEAAVGEHSAERLRQMKSEHEARIRRVTGIDVDKESHIILYGAKIGEHDSPLSYRVAANTIISHDFFPSSAEPFELGMGNTTFRDDTSAYWDFQVAHLEQIFKERLTFTKQNHSSQHYSIFAFAPQPLLIKLGTLLSDIYAAEVYQRHRTPATWEWVDEKATVEYMLQPPTSDHVNVALNISLSATITNDRITDVLDGDTSIWTLTIPEPNNDYLRNRKQLNGFTETIRKAFDQIKARHGQNTILNVFPAMPVSTAVEMGRAWMPKADMKMKIFDQHRKNSGFFHTISIQ